MALLQLQAFSYSQKKKNCKHSHVLLRCNGSTVLLVLTEGEKIGMKQRKNWAGLYINWSNIPTTGGSTPIWAEPLISIFRNTRKTDFMFRAEYLRSEEKIVQARSVVHVAPDIRPGHAPCHFPQIQYRVCSQKRERENKDVVLIMTTDVALWIS
jgi:hypothetical protein